MKTGDLKIVHLLGRTIHDIYHLIPKRRSEGNFTPSFRGNKACHLLLLSVIKKRIKHPQLQPLQKIEKQLKKSSSYYKRNTGKLPPIESDLKKYFLIRHPERY